MQTPRPRISIVIPVYNEELNIQECLTAICNLNYPKDQYEIIVVDNGSTDKSLEIAKKYPVKILIKPGIKIGAVRNYGASFSQGDILVFLDSDCIVDKWWLSKGVKQLENDALDAVGGLCRLRDNPSWIEKNWILKSSGSFIYQRTFIGACIFIKKEVFENMGGFNEILNTGEDCFLTEQLIDNGYKIRIDPQLTVVHLGFPTTILDFIKRQVWQSSDYFNRLGHVFQDITLLLVVIFTLCLLALPIMLVTQLDENIINITLIALLFIPIIFSFKRIYRYGGINATMNPLAIYIVDILYLLGRSYGLIRGGILKLFYTNNSKTIK